MKHKCWTKRAVSVFVILVMVTIPFPNFVHAAGQWEILEKGFESCIENDYDTHGWEDYYLESHWGAVAGHNCTNYAAYMAILNGAETRIGGNGAAWAENAEEAGYLVNQKPAVGAIAQWDADSLYFRAAGHVAYVEEVKDTYIIVSEDNYSGDFQWRKIYKDDCWPSNFIHVSDGVTVSKTTKTKSPLTVTANVATNVTATDAKLSGFLSNPKKLKITEVGIEIGTNRNKLKEAGWDKTKYTYAKLHMWYDQSELEIDFTPGTTYYYRMYAISDKEVYYSDIKSFTTTEER